MIISLCRRGVVTRQKWLFLATFWAVCPLVRAVLCTDFVCPFDISYGECVYPFVCPFTFSGYFGGVFDGFGGTYLWAIKGVLWRPFNGSFNGLPSILPPYPHPQRKPLNAPLVPLSTLRYTSPLYNLISLCWRGLQPSLPPTKQDGSKGLIPSFRAVRFKQIQARFKSIQRTTVK